MSMNIKTQEFLQKLKVIGNWNKDYDYPELIYIKTQQKRLLIIKVK